MRSYSREKKILRELAGGKKTLWELLASYHWTLRDFISDINRLYDEGKISTDGKYIYLKEKIEADGFSSIVCPKCDGRRVLPKNHVFIEKRFKRLLRDRPKPEVKFFQGYMRPEDVLARIALMDMYGDVEGKSIILIGDDDLVSLALALTGLPERIVVLDIDERLGEFMRKALREDGVKSVEFIHHDVAEPLPKDLRRKFDVFVTDPLETVSGLKAFLCRAACALKPTDSAGYFGLTTLEASPKKWLWVQGLLYRMNLAITDAVREHSSYPTQDYHIGFPYEEPILKKLKFKYELPPDVSWYKSTFFRAEAVGKVRPIHCSKHIRVRVWDEDDITWPNR
ncbi:MAG: bis-aminopropyl spermidine synthase family protein [Candidatus Hadarchaeales archaeon]